MSRVTIIAIAIVAVLVLAAIVLGSMGTEVPVTRIEQPVANDAAAK